MSPKFRNSLLTWAGILAVFMALQFIVNRGLVSGTPPPIQAPGLDGQPFAGLDTLPKPAVVYFWASWCRICRSMQDTVQTLSKETPMITVALQSGDAAEVRAYMEKQGFQVPVVLDEDGTLGKAYGIRGVPAVFILGRDGTIRLSTVGYTSGIGFRVRLWLAGLQ